MFKINLKQFGVDIRNFEKGEKIGKGGFSEVYLTAYKKTGKNYAAKILKNSLFKADDRAKIENEIDILTNAKHPTIIEYLGFSLLDFCLDPNIVIFTEYATNGSLGELISRIKRSKPPPNYDNTCRQIILIGIAAGMKYLHHTSIMHRDLKTNNILLDENYRPYITDFGMAKYVQKNKLFEQTPLCGTLPYMAPEMILGKKYSYKIDVYAFGIIMYEVVCEDDLYPTITKKDQLTAEFKEYVALSNNRPEFRKEIKSNIKRLIQKCWAPEIKDRPSFDDVYEKLIKKDYFLDNVDEDRVKDYVDYITQNDMYSSSNFELIQKVRDLLNENKNLKDQMKSLKRENENLINERNQMKKMIDEIMNASKTEIKPPPLKDENSPRVRHFKNDFSTPQKYINDSPFKYLQKQKEIEITPNTKIRFIKPKEDENENKIIFIKQKDNDNDIKTIRNLKPQKEEEIIILQETENSPIIHQYSPQKEKVNGNLLITASPRRYNPISRINKDDDDNVNKVEESNVKLPSLIKPKKTQFNPSNYGISVSEFNSYTLQQQLQVIKSKIISINSSASISKNRIQFFKNIYKTLNYIIRLVNSPETSNYFLGIQTDNQEDKFDNVCESNQVVFLYNSTELLYERELLESSEIREFFKLFKHVSIEIKYFSKSFRRIYETVFQLSHVKIQIFFTGMKKTDITFKGDKYIKSIRFDNTVNCIGDYAFNNCLSLKQVFIPSSVTSIGSGSFEGCCSLKSISIPSSVTSIGFSVFKGCSELTEVIMNNSIKLIRGNAFNGCSSLSQISLPSSITSIDDYAFYGCSELKIINIPSSVIFIGQFAFSKCVALHSIVIPPLVKSIGKSAFRGCDALEKISIPSSIKNVSQLDIKTGCKISTL